MQFTKSLKPKIQTGEVTTSIRIWKTQRVKKGNRYRLNEGWIEVESIMEISLQDITPNMARKSGFSGLAGLLKVAKHGAGEKVFFIRFFYIDSV